MAQPGSGWVRVVEQRTTRQLQLIGIRLGNDTEAEVRLTVASDLLDSGAAEAVAFRTLGTLAAGARSANYDIDPSVDLAKFRAVTLWSPAKHLNLITAPLQAAESREN